MPDVPQVPSKQLQKVLFGQKLCTSRDVRRCGPRVRRLSRDLPTFDSVWLDALVQSRVLTAFQTQTIEAEQAEKLTIGPCLILDQLGRSHQSETFLARHRSTRSPCVIKQVSVPVELSTRTLASLKSLVENGQRIDRPGLILPRVVSEEVVPDGRVCETGAGADSVTNVAVAAPTSRLNIVSRYCEALSLSQLILRRGRLPAATVVEIARQMLDSLVVLHSHKLVHGDLSLSNSLLDRTGQVVLVDCGIRATVQPVFQIAARETPERYDGIAPELIGTGRSWSKSGDLYALGCLLWHLLAGRSAFPTGDPLARLAAHQTERIPDIREVAPETPQELAEAVLWLTEPEPRKRPLEAGAVLRGTRAGSNCAAVVESGSKSLDAGPRVDVRSRPAPARKPPYPRATLGQPKLRGRRDLSKFAQSFQHPALRTATPGRGRPFVMSLAAATAAVLLAGSALFYFEPHSRRLLLTSFSALRPTGDETVADLSAETPSEPRDLPAPDDFGRIELPSQGPWRAGRITWTGQTLTIQSTGDSPARLLIETEPLRIRASQIVLDGIRVEQSNRNPERTVTSLALLQSQALTIRNCEFVSTGTELPRHSAAGESDADQQSSLSEDGPVSRYAVGWQALDTSDRLAGQVIIENSVFAGDWSTIWLDGTDRPVLVTNSLKTGPGAFFVFEQSMRRGDTRAFVLKNVTLRNAGPLVAMRLVRNWLWDTRLSVTLNDCVIDPLVKNDDLRPLLAFEGETLPRNWQSTLTIEGARSFVRPGTALAGIEKGLQFATLPTGQVDVRGLGSAEFRFRGDMSDSPEDSVIDQLFASRRAAQLPGIRTRDNRLVSLVDQIDSGGPE